MSAALLLDTCRSFLSPYWLALCSVDGVMGPSYGPSLCGRQDSKLFGTGLPIIPSMNAQYSERRRPLLILSLSLHFNNIFLNCNCEIVRKIFIKCVGMWCICHNIDVKIDQKLSDVSDAVILWYFDAWQEWENIPKETYTRFNQSLWSVPAARWSDKILGPAFLLTMLNTTNWLLFIGFSCH